MLNLVPFFFSFTVKNSTLLLLENAPLHQGNSTRDGIALLQQLPSRCSRVLAVYQISGVEIAWISYIYVQQIREAFLTVIVTNLYFCYLIYLVGYSSDICSVQLSSFLLVIRKKKRRRRTNNVTYRNHITRFTSMSLFT